jgi:Fe-S-cluster containining protein
MRECRRCGNCCINATFRFAFGKKEEDIKKLKDMSKWLSYHGCQVREKQDNDKKKFYVTIPIVCNNLIMGKDHKWECMDYENRPELCKRYQCQEELG